MRKITYIYEKTNHGNTAGTKLKEDLMSFFEQKGFEKVNKKPLISQAKKDLYTY